MVQRERCLALLQCTSQLHLYKPQAEASTSSIPAGSSQQMLLKQAI